MKFAIGGVHLLTIQKPLTSVNAMATRLLDKQRNCFELTQAASVLCVVCEKIIVLFKPHERINLPSTELFVKFIIAIEY